MLQNTKKYKKHKKSAQAISSQSKNNILHKNTNVNKLYNKKKFIELAGKVPRSSYKRSNIDTTKTKELLMAKQISMYHQLQALVEERKKDKALIEAMLNNKTKKIRKSRKTLSHFDFITKRIAKNKIFRMVKFVISEQDMNKYTETNSIGYHFLQELKKEDQVHKSTMFEGNEETIWNNAKYLVHEAIGEKRNARQTQIKKAWKGLYCLFIIDFYEYMLCILLLSHSLLLFSYQFYTIKA